MKKILVGIASIMVCLLMLGGFLAALLSAIHAICYGLNHLIYGIITVPLVAGGVFLNKWLDQHIDVQ